MEAYKVIKPFEWNGWTLAQPGPCNCGCGDGPDETDRDRCTGEIGTGCPCADQELRKSCHCYCGVKPARYGGGIWLVEEAHPNKESMLVRRYAVYDISLPPVDELMKDPDLKRILQPPSKRYLTQAAKTPAATGG